MSTFRVGLSTASVALAFAASAVAADITVPAGADLQAALDRAQPGDVITLQPGATYSGNFVLGAKGGSTYVTVRSALPDAQLPAAGARMTATLASGLARIESPNLGPAIRTVAGAHHWRLLALEIRANSDGTSDIVRLGDGSSEQHSLDAVPHDLVVDRCYVHGNASSSQKRGIALNSASTSIVNSWISEIKSADQDSQAIAGWNGPGPFVIQNNYLEAAGENFLLGGADPAIDGLVPTGVTFRDNWVRKQTGWMHATWQVKNLLELKNARGVVIENNLFENNWQAAQPGYAILFTPRNQDGQSPWATVQDVTFRSNIVRHVAAAINILGHDSPHSSQQARGITIANNLVYDVNSQAYGGNGNFLMLGDAPATVVIEHNTVLQSGNIIIVYGGSSSSPKPVTGFVFRNNLVLHNDYGIKGDNVGMGNSTLKAYFPGAIVSSNVIAGGQASLYPSGNHFPSVRQFYAQFVSASANNYQLAASSSYLKGASDGGAMGADTAALQSVIVRSMSNAQSGPPRPDGDAVSSWEPPAVFASRRTWLARSR